MADESPKGRPGLLRRLLSRRPRREPLRLTLVTRSDCGLCEEMKREMVRARAAIPYRVEEVDLHSSRELEDRYALSVPVLLIEGRPAFEGRLTAEAFVERLARAAAERESGGGEGRPA